MDNDELQTRYRYHPPTPEQQRKYEALRATARVFAAAIDDLCPESREKALAHTNLEQCVMWANAAIARRS
jgi:hypothetical protein